MDKYKAYEVIFRIMPALPNRWKIKLTIDKVAIIPKFMVRPLSMISDVITGFGQNNPEFSAYALHNLYHIRKFLMAKIGLKASNATKVVEDIPFIVPENLQTESKNQEIKQIA